MLTKKHFLILIAFVFSMTAQAQFDFNAGVVAAYRDALSLRLTAAKAGTSAAYLNNKNNLAVDYVNDYVDFFKIFINEDKEEYERLAGNKDYRLGRIEKLGDKKSPYHLFMQAQIRLHWAIVKVKFEEYLSAAVEVKKAFSLLEENKKKFPDFMPNKASLGCLHAVVGTIPDDYKWGVNLVGMNGTIAQGQREVEEALAYSKKHQDFLFDEETIVMYSFLLLHLGNASDEAWATIKSPRLNPSTSSLACFVQANVAMHTAHTDDAIKLLLNRPKTAAYHPFYYLDFMLGIAKLQHGDTDADTYLQNYTHNFKGRHYIKECYQKLAWSAFLENNLTGYKTNMDLCKVKGATAQEVDKKALKDAQNSVLPNANLLRARLYCDGGYYTKAKTLVSACNENSFKTVLEKLEYNYRSGRIYDKLNDAPNAIAFYEKTIAMGKENTAYFACNAALQLGLLYENTKKTAQARVYYNLCLSLTPSDYKDSLHQKAKAGLQRLKKNQINN